MFSHGDNLKWFDELGRLFRARQAAGKSDFLGSVPLRVTALYWRISR